MMIDRAQVRDYMKIILLWRESFGEDSFEKWFFNNQFDLNHTLVYRVNDEAVAMLQRIPYHMNKLGNVTYIYGACTDAKFRNQGIMAELLQYSEKLDEKQQVVASILIPASVELQKYYKQRGYSFDFFHRITSYDCDRDKKSGKLTNGKNKFVLNLKDVTEDEYEFYAFGMNALYHKMLSDKYHIIRSTEYTKNQIKMFLQLGEEIYCTINKEHQVVGYAFVTNDQDELKVQEMVYLNNQTYEYLCRHIYDVHKSGFQVISYQKGRKHLYGCGKMLRKYDDTIMGHLGLLFD